MSDLTTPTSTPQRRPRRGQLTEDPLSRPLLPPAAFFHARNESESESQEDDLLENGEDIQRHIPTPPLSLNDSDHRQERQQQPQHHRRSSSRMKRIEQVYRLVDQETMEQEELERQQQQQRHFAEIPEESFALENGRFHSLRVPLVMLLGPVSNLCSATLGAGIVSLPFAFYHAGVLVGSLLLLATAVCTNYSIGLLAKACHVYDKYTYEELLTASLNTRQSRYCLSHLQQRIVQISMIVFCGGCAVAYVIAIGDILQQANLLLPSTNGMDRTLTLLLVWGVCLVPLSCIRSIQSLQFASSIGIASIMTLIFCTFIHLMEDCSVDEFHPSVHDHHNVTNNTNSTTDSTTIRLAWEPSWHWNVSSNSTNTTGTSTDIIPNMFVVLFDYYFWPSNGILSVLKACPIILFAFSCQVNVCAIYQELLSAPTTITVHQVDVQRDSVGNGDISNQDHPHNHPNSRGQESEGGDGEPMPDTDVKLRVMDQVTFMAVAFCAFLYTSISVVALADFGGCHIAGTTANYSATESNYFFQTWTYVSEAGTNSSQDPDSNNVIPPNVLQAYDLTRGLMQVAAAAMAAAVLVAFPLNILPARATLEGMLRDSKEERGSRDRTPVRPVADATLTAALLEDAQQDDGSEENRADSAEQESGIDPLLDTVNHRFRESFQHYALTLLLAGSALGLALILPDISVVFGLLGGTTTSILGFIIPGLLGIRMERQASPDDTSFVKTLAPWLLLAGGVVVGILTTSVTVYSTFSSV